VEGHRAPPDQAARHGPEGEELHGEDHQAEHQLVALQPVGGRGCGGGEGGGGVGCEGPCDN
jgi:hypothetical protein